MVNLPEFQKYPKISRWNGNIIITEKIDGTNAQIWISEDLKTIVAGSRNRWLTPENDNYEFAQWVEKHREELIGLGKGHHFGEWYGCGINRNYGMSERRFALFNSFLWKDGCRPACCDVVPTLYTTTSNGITGAINLMLQDLREHGSRLVPGFMKPEGIVIYHCGRGDLFKVTIENDDVPKGGR